MRSRRSPTVGVIIGTALWIALAYGAWYFWNHAPTLALTLAQDGTGAAAPPASTGKADPAGQAKPAQEAKAAEQPEHAAAGVHLIATPAETTTSLPKAAASPQAPPAEPAEPAKAEPAHVEPAEGEPAKSEPAKSEAAPPTASEKAVDQAQAPEKAPEKATVAAPPPDAPPPGAAPPNGVRLKRPELSRLALELRVAHAQLEAAKTLLDNLCRLGPAEVDKEEYAGDAIAQMLVSDELDEIKQACGGNTPGTQAQSGGK